MKAADYHAAFRGLGEATLAPKGFVYRDKSWHHALPGKQQLSLCPHCDKFGHGFSVRYLTVALWHLDVEPPPGFDFRPRSNNCGHCPIKISPSLLRRHLESGWAEEVWACPDPLSFATRLMTHLPVYFGGEDLWVLADPTASFEVNRQSVLHALEKDEITDLNESAALARTEQACEEVARYGLKWAQGMTVARAAPLILRAAKVSADLGIHSYAPQYAKAVAGAAPSS